MRRSKFFLNSLLPGNVTASAESVNGSTPGVRATWNITIPAECVALVRVKLKLNTQKDLVSTYNTTNISETEVNQTGLQCNTMYYIRVVVDSKEQNGAWKSPHVGVFVGGN